MSASGSKKSKVSFSPVKVLAIETSTLTGSVALVSETQVISEVTLSVSVRHSERLLPAIDELLKNSGETLDNIDLFAVANGPGSFTGLRIGIATAQGLALPRKKPIVGVSTLEALALNGIFFSGLIVPTLNAYRGEVYSGIYRNRDGLLEPLSDDRPISPSALAKDLSKHNSPILLLGDGSELCREAVQNALGKDRVILAPIPLNYPRAANIASLALQKWKAGERQEMVLPRYLRVPG